ncbi:stabilizer of axonemal microtubules 2 isoform X2 [Neopsephotus bourkii]|uniref:stabilizer of axonemal microtubules 2 isoform X2 n=1 Tax=Neopsephotus bourkii TaxID=309878 RepID=UPI002AA53D4B|nr:stabilizer of axonemal microtubules 2 isoform X2 [Neopsephotus bourkii]
MIMDNSRASQQSMWKNISSIATYLLPGALSQNKSTKCIMGKWKELQHLTCFGNPDLIWHDQAGKLGNLLSDYIPHNIMKQHFQVQEEYKPKTGEMELGTTYQKDYNAHKIKPVTLVRPLERKHTTGRKMDTIPTYQDDYRPWEVQRREAAKAIRIYHPPTEKSGNSTTFRDDFVPKELNPRQSFKPPCVAKLSDVPFDGATSHRTSYIAHQLEPKFRRPKEQYKPSNQPFVDLTTHRNDFKGLPGELAKSCKPEIAKVGSNAHFNGVTEFQDRFQPWLVSLSKVRKTREYVPPPGSMDFNSRSHLDYIKHEIFPALPVRPVSNRRTTNAPFQGSTTMKEDFKAWGTCRQEIIKKQQEIPKPMGKFYDLTTFKSHYIPHQITPAQSFKPAPALALNSGPFQGETVYHTEYTPKKPEICPANSSSPPGYVYVKTDSHGHKFFRRLTQEFSKSNSNPIPKEIAVVS